jgi:murein L,D-transpeptidase YcbB/YkuD
MSNNEDFDAIKSYFQNQSAKTAKAADLRTSFLAWAPTVSKGLNWGFSTTDLTVYSDEDLNKARKFRDDFNTANLEPVLPQGEQLTPAEANYFQNMPVVNTTGMTAAQAHEAIWTKKAGSPEPPAGSVWLGGKPLASATAVKHATIKQGSKGADVVAWQTIIGIKADGTFGPETTKLTKAKQKAWGLKDDGVVGPATWAKAAEMTTSTGAPAVATPLQVAAVTGQNTAKPKPAAGSTQHATGLIPETSSTPSAFQSAVSHIESGAQTAEAGILGIPSNASKWTIGGIVVLVLGGIAYAIFGKPKLVDYSKQRQE